MRGAWLRRGLVTGAAVVVPAAIVVISVVVLLRDPAQPLLETQQVPPSAEAAPLRAEAVAVATTAIQRVELARAEGDPSRLDGLFVPGSQAEAAAVAAAAQARPVAAVSPDAVPAPVTSASVIDLARAWASVRVVHQAPGDSVTYKLVLRRVGDRWLVRDLLRQPG